MNLLLNVDKRLSKRFFLPATSSWRQLVRFVAHLGDGPYLLGGLALLYGIGWWGHYLYLRRAVLVSILVLFLVAIFVAAIKFVVRRNRPLPPGEFVTLSYDAYSFPSGHSARLAALAVSTDLFFPGFGWPLVLMAVFVALARVAVGVHYVGDILVGLGVGALIAWELFIFAPHLFG